MGKDIKRKFTVSLDIDTKDAEKQIKSTVGNLKDILANMGTASDKMNYFKELADYLSQVDAELDNFKKKHGEDLFAKTFGSLDGSLKKELESVFGVAQEQLVILDRLRSKIASVKTSDVTSTADLKPLEQEVKSLYESVGMLDKLDISGKGKIETRIKKLEAALDGFVVVFNNVNQKISEGFKLGGEDDITGISTAVQDMTDGIKKEIGELDNLKQIAKKKVTDFYDELVGDANHRKLNSIKKSLQEALSFDDKEFFEFTDIFNDLEDGIIEEDEAVKQIIEAATKIKSAKQKLDNTLHDKGDKPLDMGEQISASDNIKEATDQTIVTLEYGKKKLVNAWKDYYHAAMDAKKQGYDIESGDFTLEMDNIKYSIEKQLDDWNASTNNKHTAQYELDLAAYIEDGDIGLDDIEGEINKIFRDAGITLDIPIDEILADIDNLKNNTSKLGDAADESFQEISSELTKVEDKAQSTTDAFQELINFISKSGTSPKSFFKELESGSEALDDELKNILASLNLIDETGKASVKSIQGGFSNSGGMVTGDYTLISRNAEKYSKYSYQLQPKLLDAKNMGANIGAILEIYKDEANGLIYELQNTVKGKGILNFKDVVLNTDFLDATDEQIKKLIEDLLILQKTGLYIDWNGDNLLYDKNEGFSFIDLASKSTWFTASEENSVQENLSKFFQSAFSLDPSFSPDSNPFVQHVNDLVDQVINETDALKDAAKQRENIQGNDDSFVADIKKEENAHEQNAEAINAENQALQAQIDLKKKAQSMTWQEFALDESSLGLKNAAGLYTLKDAEKFWKKSNYEKNIDFHEITRDEADAIIDTEMPHDLRSKWYSKQDFAAKTQIENTILANDKLRNAAINKLYHLYKQYIDSAIEFDEFLNSELSVYRGDYAPVVYGEEQQLSFSFNKHTAKTFNGNVQETKIIPKETVGNVATKSFEDELEVFVPNSKTPYIADIASSFEEYYENLTSEMQKEVDRRLIKQEKNRVESLLGKKLSWDVEKLVDGGDLGLLDQFSQGVIPKSIDPEGLYGIDNDYFGDTYNQLSELQQRLVAYYATLLSELNTYHGSKHFSSSEIGQTGLFNVINNDALGVKQHVANLTGESRFNIFGETTQDVNAEAAAHKANTQAIKAEKQAQDELNNSKASYSDAYDQLTHMALKNVDNSNKFDDIFKIIDGIHSVENTVQSSAVEGIIDDGNYISDSTGEVLSYVDLDDMVHEFEFQYGENLQAVKDYLYKVFEKYNADIEALLSGSNIPDGDIVPDVDEVHGKLLTMAQESLTVAEDMKLQDINDLISYVHNNTKDSDWADDFIPKGEFVNTDNDKILNYQDIIDEIDNYEKSYGESLQFVKDYLSHVFKDYLSDVEEFDAGFEDFINKTNNMFDSNDAVVPNLDDVNAKLAAAFGNTTTLDEGMELSDIETMLNFVGKNAANPDWADLMSKGEFLNPNTGELLFYQDVVDMVNNFEKAYGQDLQFAKDYLDHAFADFKLNSSDLPKYESDDWDEDWGFTENDDELDLSYDDASDAQQHLQIEQEITAEKQKQAAIDNVQFDPDEELTVVPSKSDIFSEEDIQAEINSLDKLLFKVNEVKQAIDEKTMAFKEEGNIVDQVVQEELLSLAKLSVAIEEIQAAINSIKHEAINGDVDTNEIVKDSNEEVSVEANITDDNNTAMGDYALDDTLLKTNGILENILAAIGNNESISQLVSPLSDAIIELKNVSHGIVEHQKAQQTDKSAASARIANNYGQLSSISNNAVSSLGDEVQIKQMRALANDVVRVEGAVRDADGVWKGFIVDINESNSAVIHAIDEQSAFAKALNESAQAAKRSGDETTKAIKQDDFSKSLIAQKTAFNQYRDALKDVDYLSDEIRDKIDALGLGLQTVSDDADLTSWKKSFETLKDEMSVVESVFNKLENEKLSKIRGKLNSEFKSLDFTTTTQNPTAEQQEILNLRKQIITQLEEYEAGIESGKQVELDSLNQTMAALRNKINVYKEANDLINAGGKSGQNFGSTIALNATAKFNSLKQQATGVGSEFANSAVVQQAFKEYELAYDRLIAKRKELAQLDNLTDSQVADFKQLQTECNNYAKALSKIITDSQKLNASAVNEQPYLLGSDFDDSVSGRKAALTDFVQELYGVSVATEDFKDNFNEVVFAVDNGDGTFTQMSATFNAARTQIVALAGDTKKATGAFESFVNELKGKFKSISAYLISSFSIQEVWQQVRKGVEYVREIDSALTELKKVTDETDASYDKFLQDMSKTAGVIGSTVSELTTMSADWARLGYSMEEAGKLAESTAILLNVSEFDDATKASEALISTMQAFQYTADESQHVVDILNEVKVTCLLIQ